MSARKALVGPICAAAMLLLSGCAVSHPPSGVTAEAQLTPASPMSRDLARLPAPAGKIAVAVYGFRDQTGQYKPSPDSSFSTAVTQGSTSLLIKTLKDSGWFIPVERENLQNLLTERKIIRALETPQPAEAPRANVPALLSASLLIEGGVVAYESNVRTGGAGAKYLGIGLSNQYRVDQVTVNLRTVDSRNGEILHSISTTKTIYSYEIRPSIFKFVNVKDLVEIEAGMTRNEPAQMCVAEAIEAAVLHLIANGIKSKSWALKSEGEMSNPVLAKYLAEQEHRLSPKDMALVEASSGGDADWAGERLEPARVAAAASQRRSLK